MPIFKFLHIASMFMYVGMAVGTDFLLHRIARSGDVRAIRIAFRLFRSIELIVPGFFVLGILFGLTTAFTGGFNFVAPWLIIAYTLVVMMFISGGAIGGVWIQKVEAAAATSPDNSPSPELQDLIHDRTSEYAMWFGILLIVAIVFDMVVKPFS